MQDPPQQNCPLFNVSTELRLEICRFAVQQDLDVIKSVPHSYDLTDPPFRGALALLPTCRALRVESIDAIEPLARTSRSVLEHEWVGLLTSMMLCSHSRPAESTDEKLSQGTVRRVGSSVRKIKKVCELLAVARGIDDKTSVN
jgi:hypothetical protein